jgi:uncharacterized protein (UPF0335 family)
MSLASGFFIFIFAAMKIRCILYLLLSLLVLGSVISCKEKGGRGQKDLEHALMMLRDRREAESRVVKEQAEIRAQLEENYNDANSDGMRNKILKEIRMVDISIEKAQLNMANQDTIIFQLEQKLDSIILLEKAAVE